MLWLRACTAGRPSLDQAESSLMSCTAIVEVHDLGFLLDALLASLHNESASV